MPTYLKVLFGDIANASRDRRELSVAEEVGFDVKVLQIIRDPGKDGTMAFYGNIEITSMSSVLDFSRFKHPWVFEQATRFTRLSQIMKKIRSFGADVISGHDVIALGIIWLAVFWKSKTRRPKLVYDAHEFEIGRNTRRSRLGTALICRLERFLMKRCAVSIVVNDSIANELQKAHHLIERPLVVRSTPENWRLDPVLMAQRREEMKRALKAGENAFLVMYHGAILVNRGIERLVECVAAEPLVYGVVMGYTLDKNCMEELQQLGVRLGAADRMLYLPPTEPERIWEYAGAVDAGITVGNGKHKSYYISLPNKFFENVQSMTPIIASDFPEMRQLIDKYGIGLTCDPNNMEEIRACINKLRTDKAFYAECKRGLERAKRELCWENEKKPLIRAFSVLF